MLPKRLIRSFLGICFFASVEPDVYISRGCVILLVSSVSLIHKRFIRSFLGICFFASPEFLMSASQEAEVSLTMWKCSFVCFCDFWYLFICYSKITETAFPGEVNMQCIYTLRLLETWVSDVILKVFDISEFDFCSWMFKSSKFWKKKQFSRYFWKQTHPIL